MQNRKAFVPERPGILIYAAALTSGVLAALAVQIWLARAGFDLTGLWQDLFSAKALQLRTAGPWWAMASAAFVAGGAMAATLSRLPLPWRRFRALRWALGAAMVFLLAHIGHSAAMAPAGVSAAAHVAASLTALCIATLLATCGAYFAARR